MKFIGDIMDRLAKVRADKEAIQRKEQLRQESAGRIDDMLLKFHQVGEVQLPIPNLFADTQIKKYFGDYSRINLATDLHLAAVVFFLKNNSRVEIASWPREQVQAAILAQSTEIPLQQRDEYAMCIDEMFAAIKKKSIHHQRAILLQLADQLGVTPEQLLQVGEK